MSVPYRRCEVLPPATISDCPDPPCAWYQCCLREQAAPVPRPGESWPARGQPSPPDGAGERPAVSGRQTPRRATCRPDGLTIEPAARGVGESHWPSQPTDVKIGKKGRTRKIRRDAGWNCNKDKEEARRMDCV